jgi:hypothetical protein
MSLLFRGDGSDRKVKRQATIKLREQFSQPLLEDPVRPVRQNSSIADREAVELEQM